LVVGESADDGEAEVSWWAAAGCYVGIPTELILWKSVSAELVYNVGKKLKERVITENSGEMLLFDILG
jgi:hypothetical protein